MALTLTVSLTLSLTLTLTSRSHLDELFLIVVKVVEARAILCAHVVTLAHAWSG